MNPKEEKPKKSIKEQKIEVPKTDETKKKEKNPKKAETQKKEKEQIKLEANPIEIQKSQSEPFNAKNVEISKKPKKTIFALVTYNEYQHKHHLDKQENSLHTCNSSSVN